ncbi:MAG: MBL fold metallo-hydrolase [Oscillospiraceae bacterium]
MIIEKRSPYSHEFQAWLDKARSEGHSKIYDIDPFAEVFNFREGVYHLLHESPEGPGGSVWVHVVVGPEKVFVLDAAWGIGNLSGLVDELSGGKEVVLANSHPHLDHAYGNVSFTRAYCHEYCAPMLLKDNLPTNWDPFVDENGDGLYLNFSRKDIAPYREYEVVPCANHTMLNLGGDHNIELIWSPGHAAGGAVYIDHKNRILFSGDSILVTPTMVGASPKPRLYRVYKNEYMTVSAFRKETELLAQRLDEFDTVVPQHHTVFVDKSIVTDMAELLKEIEENPDSYDELIYNRHKLPVKIKRHGLAGLMYGDFAIYGPNPEDAEQYKDA